MKVDREGLVKKDNNATVATIATIATDGIGATGGVLDSQKLRLNATLCDPKDSNVIVNRPESVYGLSTEISNFVDNSIGSFNINELDRYVGIGKEQASKRNKILHRLYKEKKIIRVSTGVYEKTEIELNRIVRNRLKPSPFSVHLPLGLSELVKIPKKAVILIAGTSNAGKTQFLLETAKANVKAEYPIGYFMSEMSDDEVEERLVAICDGDDEVDEIYKKVYFAQAIGRFAGAIRTHCRNGLSFVDFLEPVDSEYFRLTNDIKTIYESLDEGVSIIAMQKTTGGDFARGGEGTTEKARLYLSIDLMDNDRKESSLDFGMLVRFTIVKAKSYFRGRNPVGKEIHCLVSDEGIVPISGWDWVNKAQRTMCLNRYKNMSEGDFKVAALGVSEVVS